MYKRCEICENNSWCDMGIIELHHKTYNKTHEENHDASLEGHLLYFIGNSGYWETGEYGDYKRVEKSSHWRDDMRRFCCYQGLASHPKYLKCNGCKEFSTCELGQFKKSYDQKKREETKLAKRKQQAEDWENTKEFFKLPFKVLFYLLKFIYDLLRKIF